MTSNCECDSSKILMYMAISSQAAKKLVEGSTTNAYSPNIKLRAMKRHERAPAKVFYVYFLLYRDMVQSRQIHLVLICHNRNICGELGKVELNSMEQSVRLMSEE